MRVLSVFLAFLFGIISSVSLAAPGEPLPAEEAFSLSVHKESEGSLSLQWTIADGYYLYRDFIQASEGERDLEVLTLPGTNVEDPTFGASEVYYSQAEALVSGFEGDTIDIVYQGCQEDGLCYRPERRTIDVHSPEIALNEGLQIASGLSGMMSGEPSLTMPGARAENLQMDDSADVVSSLRSKGGIPLVLGAFVLFGLLLAFTPCVLPMYPILAGMLARQGPDMTHRQGLLLTCLYVLGLATAFAGLGAFAGWSGQNLQMILQSSVTTAIIASLFVLLALSMFGLFELSLPSSLTTWVAQKTGGQGGSRRGAWIMGFSSVLIVGPCVTAPLAGALIYIAKTGDVALGAAALFSLGLGKGIPLILLGTFGGRALPRAGVWMEQVKRLFGFSFLATSVWIAEPFLPSGLNLALWAVILIAFANFILILGARAGMLLVAGRTVAAVSAIYGAVLLMGAFTGGSDPLNPLASLQAPGSARTSVEAPDFVEAETLDGLQNVLEEAYGQPAMIYFTADWCRTCRTIENTALRDTEAMRALGHLQLIKADVTDFNGKHEKLMAELGVVGPPTMVFLDGYANEVPSTRLIGNIGAQDIIRSTQAALN